MKKRMVFQFLMVLLFTLHTQAMEKEKFDPSVPVNDICYLLMIPMDICNDIVRFLMWESQQEFEERVKIGKKVPGEYYKMLPRSANKCLARQGDDITKDINAVFCPSGTKIALFELCCGTCGNPGLMIIDTQKDKQEEKIIYHDKLTQENYCALGLAASGDIIAVIKKRETVSNNNCHMHSYYNVLAIERMVKKEDKWEFKEEKIFYIPDYFIPQKLDFNKQNSCLTMQGKNTGKDPLFCSTNIVFSFQDFTLNKKPIFVEEKNKSSKESELFNYFKYKGICKSIEQKKL